MNEDARTKSAFSTVEACRSVLKLDYHQLTEIAQNVEAFDACGKNHSWYFHWCQSPHEETFSTWKDYPVFKVFFFDFRTLAICSVYFMIHSIRWR